MSKKSELEQAYIDGLGVAVIALLVSPETISFEMARWPGAEHWKKEEMAAAFCFERSSHAELVMCGLTTLSADTDEAIKLLAQVVGAVGAAWQSADQVLATAAEVTAEIELHVTAWNRSGGLSDFNAAYKRHRQRCLATSQIATSYSDFIHAFKVQIARSVGKNIAAGRTRYFGIAELRPDPLPVVKVDGLHHSTSKRDRYNDGPKTGRPHVPGWTHPNKFSVQ